MSHRLFGFLLLLAVAVTVAGGIKVWKDREERRAQAELAAKPEKKLYGPCEDHRPAQPEAPAVGGLEPRVLVFSADCRWLLSGNDNGSVHVYDAKNGQLLARAPAQSVWISQLLVTPDDKLVFSASHADDFVSAFTLPELKPVARIETGRGGTTALAWDDKRKLLLTGGSELRGWKLGAAAETGAATLSEPAFSVAASGRIGSIAVSPDAAYVATASAKSLQLWQYGAGEPLALSEAAAPVPGEFRERILVAGFSVDGKLLVSVSQQKEIAVRQVPSLEPLAQAAASPPVWGYFTDPWKLTARPPHAYQGPDKAQLIIKLADPAADRFYAAIYGKPYALRGLLQAAGNDGGISIFDFYENRRGAVVTIPSSSGGRPVFLTHAAVPGSTLLAGQRRDGTISIVDYAAMKEVKTVKAAGEKGELAATGDGRYVAYSRPEEIGFVDVQSGALRTLARPRWREQVQRINLPLAPSLDGAGIVAIFGERLVEIRPDMSVREVVPLPMLHADLIAPLPARKGYLIANPDGAALYGNPAQSLAIPLKNAHGGIAVTAEALYYKDDNGICRLPLTGPGPCQPVAKRVGDAADAVLDADAKHVVEGGKLKILRVYRTDGGGEPLLLSGHTGRIQFAKLLGDRVLSMDTAGEVRVWALADGRLIAKAAF